MAVKNLRVDFIEWEDHASLADAGWKEKNDADELEPVACKSVGFVVKENRHRVVLVGSLAADNVDGEICILKSCIRKRETIWP